MLRFVARWVAMAASLSLIGVLLVPGTPASASAGSVATCLSDNGTDVGEYFDVRGDVVWPNIQGLSPSCLTVGQGNRFVRAHGWITQLSWRAAYPDGYVPDHRAPVADFLSKLTRSRYVISRDGQVEISRIVEGRALFEHAHLGRFGDLFVAPDTTLVPGATIEARSPEWTTLEPFDARGLPVGEHTIEIYWTLSDAHCDGFTRDTALSCLPAGETLTTQTTFTVVDRG